MKNFDNVNSTLEHLFIMTMKDDEAYVLRAKKSFEYVYTTYQDYVIKVLDHHYLVKAFPCLQNATMDVMQNTFLRLYDKSDIVYKAFEKHRCEKEEKIVLKFKSYLSRMAENELRDYIKKHKIPLLLDETFLAGGKEDDENEAMNRSAELWDRSGGEPPERGNEKGEEAGFSAYQGNSDANSWLEQLFEEADALEAQEAQEAQEASESSKKEDLLRQALSNLSKKKREILLTTIEYTGDGRHTPDEVIRLLCEKYQIRPDNLRTIRRRALNDLRKMLEKEIGLFVRR